MPDAVSSNSSLSDALERLQKSTYDFTITIKPSAISESLSEISSFVERMATVFLKSSPSYCDALDSTFSKTFSELELVCNNIDMSYFSDFLTRYAEMMSRPSADMAGVSFSSERLRDSITTSLAEAKPFISQEQQQLCENSVVPSLNRKISLSDMLALLSLLLSLWFGLLSLLPNEQLNTIIEQQTLQIEAERKENEALLNAIDSLSATVEQLSAEIDLYRNQSENPTDFETGCNDIDDADRLDHADNYKN